MRVRSRVLAVGAVLAATLLAAPAGASGSTGVLGAAGDPPGADAPAQDLVSFGISPAGADRPDDRPYLSMEAPAGAVVYEHAALLNQDDQPIHLDVYGTDVVMAEGGGITARTRADTSTDAGSWIGLDVASVDVPAQTAATGFGFTVVPFTVSIPADAEPGDHVAGLVASLVSSGQGGANAPGIDFEQRVVARVYIRVAGALDPQLQVTDVRASWKAGSPWSTGAVTVRYTLRNTGNVRMAVEPSVGVAGPFGVMARHATGERVDELMPGGVVEQTTTVSGVWPLLRETVTVSATAVAAANGADPGVGTVRASVSLWAVPLVWISIVLALLAALGGLVVRRRRRIARRKARAALRAARRAGPPDTSSTADVREVLEDREPHDAPLAIPRTPARR
ncbi:MAG TPA: hypothetical protein VGK35_12790 [Actinotalea sp.]